MGSIWMVHWNNGPREPERRSGPFRDAEEALGYAMDLESFNPKTKPHVVEYQPVSQKPHSTVPQCGTDDLNAEADEGR